MQHGNIAAQGLAVRGSNPQTEYTSRGKAAFEVAT